VADEDDSQASFDGVLSAEVGGVGREGWPKLGWPKEMFAWLNPLRGKVSGEGEGVVMLGWGLASGWVGGVVRGVVRGVVVVVVVAWVLGASGGWDAWLFVSGWGGVAAREGCR
jgi:hypothetical protein